MKGGNTVIVYALKALQEVGVLDDIQVIVAYTGEEEKPGIPLSNSRKELIEAGEWADIGLGFESAVNYDDSDWGTVARRSASEWILTVEGKQAHSSGIFGEDVGAGAIFEAARILDAFYEEVRGEEYLTFNAGTIQGGTDVDYYPETNRGKTFGKTNVVPRKLVVHGGENSLPHTNATIEFSEGYPPMFPSESNRGLLSVLSKVNEDLGRGPMQELDPSRRGAADVSFVDPYTETLAGLGPPHESIDLSSLPLAIKRTAILIYRLSQEADAD
jgi:glutamate carboxypeptidase